MPEIIEAIAAKDFTSTVLGSLDAGQKIKISTARYETWLAQGLVLENEEMPAEAVAPEPVEPPKPKKKSIIKSAKKKFGKKNK